MNSFSKEDVLAACRTYGPLLHLPAALIGARLMAALASNESSLGADCGPRHEPAYDAGGRYAANVRQARLLLQFGSAAACSYGPWQMMLMNFVDRPPGQLLTDLDICAQDFVAFFNGYVIGARHAATLNDVGQVWNSGHISTRPSDAVAAYCAKLATNYAILTV
jgi:hypothetical protein